MIFMYCQVSDNVIVFPYFDFCLFVLYRSQGSRRTSTYSAPSPSVPYLPGPPRPLHHLHRRSLQGHHLLLFLSLHHLTPRLPYHGPHQLQTNCQSSLHRPPHRCPSHHRRWSRRRHPTGGNLQRASQSSVKPTLTRGVAIRIRRLKNRNLSSEIALTRYIEAFRIAIATVWQFITAWRWMNDSLNLKGQLEQEFSCAWQLGINSIRFPFFNTTFALNCRMYMGEGSVATFILSTIVYRISFFFQKGPSLEFI